MKDFSPLNLQGPVVGFPARLCTITRLDGLAYRIAESDQPVTIGGVTWVPMPGISISAVKHTSNGDMPSAQITGLHDRGTTFDSNDVNVGRFDGAKVQIYIVDLLNLTTPKLLFTGSVGNITYDTNNQAVIDVQGLSAFAKILMTMKRSPMCRTDLFSQLCQVDKTLYDVATTVVAIQDAFNFQVIGVSNPSGWFNQGVMVLSNGTGLEMANWDQSTQLVTTYMPSWQLLTVGDAITLYPGCDKTLATGCAKFSNQINFQGEPHFTGTAAAAQQV